MPGQSLKTDREVAESINEENPDEAGETTDEAEQSNRGNDMMLAAMMEIDSSEDEEEPVPRFKIRS